MVSSSDRRSIRAQSLRPSFVEAFEAKKITKLYEWQADAVQAAGHTGRNFVYSAPTSGGKSLVADILMLNALQRAVTNWHKPRAKALVLVPYLSIAAERCSHLQELCHRSNLRVKGYASSDSGRPFSNPRENIAVCSYEKGNSALNRLIENSRTAELCCVVIDEFHMLVDPGRGAALEVLITKLRHFAPTTAQLICISATMRGLDGVIDWLDATLFKTDFRPIQLEEHVVLGQAMFRVNGTLPAPADFADTSIVSTHLPSLSDVPAFPNDMGDVLDGAGLHLTRVLPSPASNVMRKGARQIQIGDHIALQLAMEGMAEATGGCLVFCKSRKGCEASATVMSKVISQEAISEVSRQQRISVALDLLATQSGRMHQPLHELLLTATGVAYHHAELSPSERRAVEQAFRDGIFHTLFCTSTLAAGINLPASICIIKCHNDRHGLKRSDYLQMIGRAGRPGFCDSGKSFLVCQYFVPCQDSAQAEVIGLNKCSLRNALRVIQAQVAELKSSLVPKDWDYQHEDLGPMKKLVLEVMMLENLTTRGVFELMHATLAASEIRCADGATDDEELARHDSQPKGNHNRMQPLYNCGLAALRGLNQEAFVSDFKTSAGDTCNKADITFPTTILGRAVFYSGLPLDQAKALFAKLEKTCQSGLCVDSHPLHLLWVLLLAMDSRVQVEDWSAYAKLIQVDDFFPHHISNFADHVEVVPRKGPLRDQLLRPNKAPNKDTRVQHGALLVAVCLLRILTEDADPHEVALRWTCVPHTNKPLTSPPVTGRSLLNLLQNDIAQQAAMAGLLCESAGWTMLATLLSSLSHDAAAGGRPELQHLLQVDGLDASRARALYNAGLKSPQAVLEADSTTLKQALAKALPASMQRHSGPHVKGGTLAAAQIGLGVDIGANQLLVRSVDSVHALVRKHISSLHLEQELELAAAEMDAADLATAYASWTSHQTIPSPTQVSSQGQLLGPRVSTGSRSMPAPQSASVTSHVAGLQSALPTQSRAVMPRPNSMLPGAQQSTHRDPVKTFMHPSQPLQLRMASTAASSQHSKRSWSAVPVLVRHPPGIDHGSRQLPALRSCVHPLGPSINKAWGSQALKQAAGCCHGDEESNFQPSKAPRWDNLGVRESNTQGSIASSRPRAPGNTTSSEMYGYVDGQTRQHAPRHGQSIPARPPHWAPLARMAPQPQQHASGMMNSGAVHAHVQSFWPCTTSFPDSSLDGSRGPSGTNEDRSV